MLRRAASACFAMIFALTAPTGAAAQLADGAWKLNYISNGMESTDAIVKLKSQDGKVTGEFSAGSPLIPKLSLKSVSQDGAALTITLTNGNVDLVFNTVVPAGETMKLNGSYMRGNTLFPAVLTLTEDSELNIKNLSRPLDCPPAKEARALSLQANSLRVKALQSKDDENKKALLEQAAEADKTAKAKIPALQREVLEKFSDSPAVFEAALALLRTAKTNGANEDDVKFWANKGVVAAKAYGPRYEAEFASQVASALLGQPSFAKLAMIYARQAEKTLTAKSSAGDQVRVLTLVVRALKASNLPDEAKTYDLRLSKLETQLDDEYMATMPPFKGAPFGGRQGKSERVAFMELFTGATCPPCVAADLAFDVLQKSFERRDLVLIQYHVHIPGPDPMTNADTLARWDYYRKAFPKEVGGVPSSIFDGKPQGGGGGGVAQAEKKYEAYRKIIEPLMENDAGAKLAAQAVRKGDQIDINLTVDGVKNPSSQMKLRVLLAEETVRYAGSNTIRLHHNVVRAFPGGVDGMTILQPDSKHNAAINVAKLRGDLVNYLDNFESLGRTFANPARPLEMTHLRVIAFVQDDETQEILQAVQIPVESK